jgi:hypothetical protein
MSKIFDDIHKALRDRKDWDRKQELWNRLRYRGIKRTNLPYEGAPNPTYPLADTMIEKIKPLFLQQIYAPQTVATFVSKKDQESGESKLAEQFFDYQLKQNSNFEFAAHSSIDEHLQDSFCVVKQRWDSNKDQLVLEGIDPLYIIVPWYSEALQDVDWLVHVYKVSVDQYKRNKNYSRKDDDFVNQIKGTVTEESGRFSKEQDQELREGITHTNNDRQIVLWECYVRTGKNNSWVIRTISPIAGWDTPIRQLPLPDSYDGKLPFVKLSCDLNQTGWYSPRGVCEIVARFQQSLSKQWANQLQWMDFNAHPDFTNTTGSPVNTENFKSKPGGVLPPGIEKNRANEAPADFVQQMQFVRALAEDRVQVPDLSAGEHLSGSRGAKGEITARQVDAIVGQSNQGNDMRSRVFRLQMAEIYRMAWKLIVANVGDTEMTFLQDSQLTSIPKTALHLDYEIHPSGSADDWNTAAQAQKAFATYQFLQGNPNIDLRPLTEWLLERVDVQLIRRVMNDGGDGAMQGLQMMIQWVGQEVSSGAPVTPDTAKLLLQLGQLAIKELTQRGDPRIQQMAKQLQPVEQVLTQIASGQQAGGAPGAQPQQGAAQQPPPDNSPAKAQALASLMKAGAQVSPDDVNAALVAMGFPPFVASIAPTAQHLNVAKAAVDAAKPTPQPKPAATPRA